MILEWNQWKKAWDNLTLAINKRNYRQRPPSVEFQEKQIHLHDKMDSDLSGFTGHMDSMTETFFAMRTKKNWRRMDGF